MQQSLLQFQAEMPGACVHTGREPWDLWGLAAPYRPGDRFEDKVEATIGALRLLIEAGHPLILSTSWGKDSSVQLALALEAMQQVAAARRDAAGGSVLTELPPMFVVTSNTGVENPLMDGYYHGESAKLEAYVQKQGIPVTVATARPSLSQDYLVSLIGGRGIASMPGQDSKCSVDMKVTPLRKLKTKILKATRHAQPAISLIGKRWSESPDRKRRMIEAGERPDQVIEREGELQLFPIAHFTEDDIFEFIGRVRAGMIATYSHYDELVQVYRDAAGGECMVTAFADGKAAGTGCGARTGCWCCTRVHTDRSMENMLVEQPWLAPLNDLRNFIAAEHFNPGKRCYMPRSVNDDGAVTLAPNTYAPDHCEDLLRYALTIQVREHEAAYAEGRAPRFSLIDARQLLAIEVYWQRYGYHRSLQATRIWRDIYVEGARYDVPKISPDAWHDRAELPRIAMRVPLVDADFHALGNGLRDLQAEMAGAGSTVTTARGEIYAQCNEGAEFDIDEEGAMLYLAYESEWALESVPDDLPAAGLFHLMRLGVVSIRRGGQGEYDRMLRLGNAIQRLGLREHLNAPYMLARLLGESLEPEVPDQADRQLLLAA